MGKDRPSLFDYKACTWVLWKIIVDSFDFGIDVYHNTEDESQPLIDWYRESRNWKKKMENITYSWQPWTFLHEQSRTRQRMHNITVFHLRECWTNKVKMKRQGRCLFSFSCVFDSCRESRVISLKKSLRKGCYQMANIIIVWSWPFSYSFASSESWRPDSFF